MNACRNYSAGNGRARSLSWACFCLWILGALHPTLYAAGQAAPYLREGVGARALAMGNAQTAASEDAGAVYWNPALLALMPNTASLAAQTAILGWDESWTFLSAAGADPGWQPQRFAYAASWIGFSAGSDLEARSANRPEADHFFNDSENVIMLSLASSYHRNFSWGANLKFLLQALDTGSASGLGLDLGLGCQVAPGTRCALVLQDIYSTLAWSTDYTDRVPMYVRFGVRQELMGETLLAAGDMDAEVVQAAQQVTELRYHLGLEYWVFPSLAVRGGVDFGRWTLGIGWSFPLSSSRLKLDYALAGERAPGEGLSQFLSVGLDFPTKFSLE